MYICRNNQTQKYADKRKYQLPVASLALAEIMAGHGSVPLCGPDQMPCGIQVSASHVSMMPVGTFVKATARLIQRGATLHVWNVDITSPSGKLISTARVVNLIVKKRQ